MTLQTIDPMTARRLDRILSRIGEARDVAITLGGAGAGVTLLTTVAPLRLTSSNTYRYWNCNGMFTDE